VRVHSGARVADSVILNDVDVGRGALVRRAIIDKNVRIPPGTKIGYDLELDRRRGYTLSENGVVVIGKGAKFDEETGELLET
jgi:glucose-1-phosphate adenylyltransferase